jgi:hypothetical protein
MNNNEASTSVVTAAAALLMSTQSSAAAAAASAAAAAAAAAASARPVRASAKRAKSHLRLSAASDSESSSGDDEPANSVAATAPTATATASAAEEAEEEVLPQFIESLHELISNPKTSHIVTWLHLPDVSQVFFFFFSRGAVANIGWQFAWLYLCGALLRRIQTLEFLFRNEKFLFF